MGCIWWGKHRGVCTNPRHCRRVRRELVWFVIAGELEGRGVGYLSPRPWAMMTEAVCFLMAGTTSAAGLDILAIWLW